MGPLNFPPQCGRKNPKKEGVEKGKREGLGKVTHQKTNWKRNFHLSEQESTWCGHFKFPFTVHYVDGSTKSNNNKFLSTQTSFMRKMQCYIIIIIIMTNTLSLSHLKILHLTMHKVVYILQTFLKVVKCLKHCP